ncbi:hypothetical protein MIR68_005120 [Amoeboaphelidium protococcarum]|nr:hypothetical protein MIR68_005120 [Amoeboaphelidium protococcarum]
MKVIVQSLLVSTIITAVSRAAPLIQPQYQPAGENPTVLGHSSGIVVQEGNLVHYPNKYAHKPLACNGTTVVGTIWQEISEVTNVYAEYDNMAYKVGLSANASEPFTLTRYDRMTIMPEELERIQSALSKATDQNNSLASTHTTDEKVIEVRFDDK